MNLRSILLSGAALTMIAGLTFAQGNTSQQPTKTTAPTFSILIKADQDTVKIGSPIGITVVKKNESNHEINNSKAHSVEPLYQIAVTDSLGSPRPESAELLKSRKASSSLGQNWFSMSFGSLKSGGSDTARMDVSRYRDISQPGKYTIRVSQFDAESNTSIQSNAVTVTVTP